MAMLRLIAGRVCRFHGVTLADLCGPRRNGRLMLARQCVCYWARRRTGLSFSGIGRFLGNRHHSAILHAAREYPERNPRPAPGRGECCPRAGGPPPCPQGKGGGRAMNAANGNVPRGRRGRDRAGMVSAVLILSILLCGLLALAGIGGS